MYKNTVSTRDPYFVIPDKITPWDQLPLIEQIKQK